MHLESTVAQSVRVAGLGCCFSFAQGETIHTENSYKYTPGMMRALLSSAGLESVESWSDPQRWFNLHLLGPG
jgi:uncharacterized SAM-dependent methyltransferase